jgi:hypothetical protein
MMSSAVASVSKKLPARDRPLEVAEPALRAGDTENREALDDDGSISLELHEASRSGVTSRLFLGPKVPLRGGDV